MTEDVHVGCADLPHGVGWERYFEKLSFIETSVLTQRAARPSVLAKWRAAAPGPGAFAVVTPPIVPDPIGLERGVGPFLTAAALLEPAALVVRTPAAFSPSAHNRDLLRRLFTDVLPAGSSTRVWHPDGLWDIRTAVKLATEMGVVLGVDPLIRDATRDPPDFFTTLETDALYCRMTGLGRGGRRLNSAQLDELHAVVTAYPRTWMVFATIDPLADATRFQGLVGQK